jgi:hypothetical protein
MGGLGNGDALLNEASFSHSAYSVYVSLGATALSTAPLTGPKGDVAIFMGEILQ